MPRLFRTLALDHRDALRNAFRRAGIEGVTDDEMLEFKCRAVAALAPHVSGVLLDPAAAVQCRPAGPALLLPLERQGYEALGEGRIGALLDDFGPPEAAALGADGCKLLLHYRADHPQSAATQRRLVSRAAAACRAEGLELVLEPLVYSLEGEDEAEYRARFGDLVVAAARDLSGSGAGVLKLQFPGNGRCEEITAAADPLPWALLGGAEVDGETFASQLKEAVRAGASGFIAGRALWGVALGLQSEEQERVLKEQAAPLLDRLSEIVRAAA